MFRHRKFLAVGAALPAQRATTHGFAGPRMLVSTPILDHPEVADEALRHGNKETGSPERPIAPCHVYFDDLFPTSLGKLMLDWGGVMRTSALLMLLALSMASPAWAHAFLERASPPVGSEISASPPAVAITFTEGVEPLFSTIQLQGPNGAAVSVGAPQLAPDNNKVLSVQLPKLPPGTYTVTWHVTSVDTHKTEGNFQFTIIH